MNNKIVLINKILLVALITTILLGVIGYFFVYKRKEPVNTVSGISEYDICGITSAEQISTGIMAHDSWVNTALQGEESDAYMLIHNHSLLDDNLVEILSNVAQTVVIHRNQMDNDGNMQMIPEASLPLPAKYMVELVPGSYHLMLIGVTRDLKIGEEISITLKFQNYPNLTVNIPVKDW